MNFFEEMKKKAETLKQSTIANYKKNFKLVTDKVQKRLNSIETSMENFAIIETKLSKMNEDLQNISDVKEKQYNSVFFEKQLDEAKAELQAKPNFNKFGEDLEYLLNKEEVFSELGMLSQNYSNLIIG